jgi:mono/diheme cytochrome c family protein
MGRWTILVLVNLLLMGCGYSHTEITKPVSSGAVSGNPETGTGGGSQPLPSGPDYQAIRTQIFQPHCLRCHSQAGGNRGGINLESFTNVKNNTTVTLQAVKSGFMPPSGPLDPQLVTLLETWIKAGAPEKITPPSPSQPEPPTQPTPPSPPMPTPAPVPSPEPAPGDDLNYSAMRERLFQPFCIRCHSQAGGNKGRINLETFANTKKVLRKILEEVNQGSMPPAGPLDAQLIKLLNDWAASGAPELRSLNCVTQQMLAAAGFLGELDQNHFIDLNDGSLILKNKKCEDGGTQ